MIDLSEEVGDVVIKSNILALLYLLSGSFLNTLPLLWIYSLLLEEEAIIRAWSAAGISTPSSRHFIDSNNPPFL